MASNLPMARFRCTSLIFALTLHAISVSSSPSPAQAAPTAAPTLVGCFSSSKPLLDQGIYKYQSSGYCWGVCSAENRTVLGLSNGDSCWCGDKLPEAGTKVTDSHCSTPCAGYDLEDCGGGTNYFTVWLTGIDPDVPNYDGGNATGLPLTSTASKKSTSSPTHSTQTATQTGAQQSATSLSSAASSQSTGSKHNKTGTILGVVLGLTAFTALVMMALIFWCLWRRRRQTTHTSHSTRPVSHSGEPLRAAGDSESISGSSFYSAQQPAGWEEEQAVVPANIGHERSPQMAEVSDGRTYVEQLRSSHDGRATGVGERSIVSMPSTELDGHNYRSSHDWRRSSVPRAPFSPVISLPSPSPGPNAIRHHQSMEPPASLSGPTSSDALTELASPLDTSKKSVLYPSGSEVDSFDFFGDAGFKRVGKSHVNYGLEGERRDGRYELA